MAAIAVHWTAACGTSRRHLRGGTMTEHKVQAHSYYWYYQMACKAGAAPWWRVGARVKLQRGHSVREWCTPALHNRESWSSGDVGGASSHPAARAGNGLRPARLLGP